jgi:protein TonB
MAVPNRLSGSLPVSMALHLAALVLVFVIPLTAEVALPVPAAAIDAYMRAVPAPPPPASPASGVPRERNKQTYEPSHTLTVAPPAIVPELPVAALGAPEGSVDPGAPLAGAPFGEVGSVGEVTPAPAPPKPAGPVRSGELVRSPRKTLDVRPVYPDVARAARVQGTVVLEAVLDRAGRVSQVRVVKSVPLLDRSAIDAVRQWRYTPSTLHGAPVEVLMTITVTFTLQE